MSDQTDFETWWEAVVDIARMQQVSLLRCPHMFRPLYERGLSPAAALSRWTNSVGQ